MTFGQQLACGKCGCENHTLRLIKEEDEPRLGGEGGAGTGSGIETTCAKCKCVSVIKITKPGFTVTSESDGSICGGWAAEHST